MSLSLTGLMKAASSSGLTDTSSSTISAFKADPQAKPGGTSKESSPDRKTDRRAAREGSRSSPGRTRRDAAATIGDRKSAADSPDTSSETTAVGRKSVIGAGSTTAGVDSGVLKSLDNLSIRKHSDISRKHSDTSSSGRVSAAAEGATRPSADGRGMAAHSANLGRPEGKSFALPDRPAEITTAGLGKEPSSRNQRRSSGNSSSVQTAASSRVNEHTAAVVSSNSSVSVQPSSTVTTTSRQPTRPQNGEPQIGWKPIESLVAATERTGPADKAVRVLTVEEEVIKLLSFFCSEPCCGFGFIESGSSISSESKIAIPGPP
jgi:hypothetical protein